MSVCAKQLVQRPVNKLAGVGARITSALHTDACAITFKGRRRRDIEATGGK